MLDFPNAGRVLVIGDIMADETVSCKHRPDNQLPYPVLAEGERKITPGGAGNVAIALTRLGVKVRLLGTVGRDPAQEALDACFDAEGRPMLDTMNLMRGGGSKTTRKTRYYQDGRCLFRTDNDSSNASRHYPVPTPEHLESMFDGVTGVALVDHGKGTITSQLLQTIVAYAGKHSVPCYADLTRWELFDATPYPPHLDLVKTGDKRVSDTPGRLRDVRLRCRVHDVGQLVVTGDRTVVTSMHPHDPYDKLPVAYVPPVDEVGAGDQFFAVLVAGLLSGFGLDASARAAMLAARHCVRTVGTSPLTLSQFHKLSVEESPDKKILPTSGSRNNTLWRLIKGVEPIVMVNGCFDVLHEGHASLLVEARRRAGPTGMVIVAVNSDESVRQLKGKNRPVTRLASRLQMLSLLSQVDLLLPFDSEKELADLMSLLLPSFLIKGSEYFDKPITGRNFVNEVVFVNGPQVSSSGVLAKLGVD